MDHFLTQLDYLPNRPQVKRLPRIHLHRFGPRLDNLAGTFWFRNRKVWTLMNEHDNVSLEALQNCGWQGILASAGSHDCRRYAEVFLDAAVSEQDSHSAQALELLGHTATMMLKSGAENADHPLVAQAVMSGWRSSIPSDFSEAELIALRQFANEITDYELQARVADLVWITTKHFPSAQLAISAYLQSSRVLVEEQHWKAAINRLERAIRLATKLRQNDSPIYVELIDYACQLLTRTDISFGSIELLMKLLLEFGAGDPGIYINQTNKLALSAEEAEDWTQARELWLINAMWHDRNGDYVQTKSSRLHAARALERAADQALSKSPPNHGTAVAYLDDAVQDMRRLGETAETTRLHARLLEQQAHMTSELVHFEGESLNVNEQILEAQQAVKGRSTTDSLIELSSMVPTLTRMDAVSAADNIAQATPFLHSITSSAINEYGRTIAQRPSRNSDSPSEIEEARHADAVDYAADYLRMSNRVSVEFARQQLLQEHFVKAEDFVNFLMGNPFVDRGREVLIARGLHAGLVGDFALAIHLLIPQIEHSLRKVLNQAGAITSGLDDPTGIQDENNINSLLYREELKLLLGDRLLFSMKVAMVERWGLNLRNRMAHGLLSESDCYSDAARYVWSLSLHFYLLPVLVQHRGSSRASGPLENPS